MDKKASGQSPLSVYRIKLGYFIKYLGRFVHYGFVPFVLYLGLKLGQTEPDAPEITLRSFLWQ